MFPRCEMADGGLEWEGGEGVFLFWMWVDVGRPCAVGSVQHGGCGYDENWRRGGKMTGGRRKQDERVNGRCSLHLAGFTRVRHAEVRRVTCTNRSLVEVISVVCSQIRTVTLYCRQTRSAHTQRTETTATQKTRHDGKHLPPRPRRVLTSPSAHRAKQQRPGNSQPSSVCSSLVILDCASLFPG